MGYGPWAVGSELPSHSPQPTAHSPPASRGERGASKVAPARWGSAEVGLRGGGPDLAIGPGIPRGRVVSLPGADRRYGRFVLPRMGGRPSGRDRAGPSLDDREPHPGILPRVSARRWSGAGRTVRSSTGRARVLRTGSTTLNSVGSRPRAERRTFSSGHGIVGQVPGDRRSVGGGSPPELLRWKPGLLAAGSGRSSRSGTRSRPRWGGRPVRRLRGSPAPSEGGAEAPPPRPITARGTVPLAAHRLIVCAKHTRSSRSCCACWSARLSRNGSLHDRDLSVRAVRASSLGGARGVPYALRGSSRGFPSSSFALPGHLVRPEVPEHCV